MWEIVWVFTVGSVIKITNQNMNVLRVVTVFGVQNGIKGFYMYLCTTATFLTISLIPNLFLTK